MVGVIGEHPVPLGVLHLLLSESDGICKRHVRDFHRFYYASVHMFIDVEVIHRNNLDTPTSQNPRGGHRVGSSRRPRNRAAVVAVHGAPTTFWPVVSDNLMMESCFTRVTLVS